MKKIPLTHGKHAIVDDVDFETLNQYKWHARKEGTTFYAARSKRIKGKMTSIKMHREVMQTPKGMDTDHADGDGLNNQRSNLRVCTHVENTRNVKMHKDNTSGFKGVCLHKATGKWRVEIMTNGKKVNIGLFVSKFDAHEAYVEACIKYHGNFSRV